MGLLLLEVTYSTHSMASCTVPEPTLTLKYGSVPTSSQKSKNSWVPKLLSSVTPPQKTLTIEGRSFLGPIPSFQWYVSAKQPPGQRNTGTFNSLNASTTSFL